MTAPGRQRHCGMSSSKISVQTKFKGEKSRLHSAMEAWDMKENREKRGKLESSSKNPECRKLRNRQRIKSPVENEPAGDPSG